MKKITLIGLICLMTVFCVCLSACNGHKHTFEEGWTHDETYHWHKATCEHENEVKDRERHQFGTDGKCTVCDYDPSAPTTEHDLKKVPTRAETCTEDGLREHYECSESGCVGKYFDADGKELTEAELKIPAKGHGELVKRDAVAATCKDKGKNEYWECPDCGAKFDAKVNGNPMTDQDIETPIDETKHQLVSRSEVKATCKDKGNLAYWECTICHTYFEDETSGKKLTSVETNIDPENHTDLVPMPYVAPTCTDSGINAYYYCNGCNNAYSDFQGKSKIDSISDLTIPELGHDYSYQPYIADGEQGHHRVCKREDCGNVENTTRHNLGDDGVCVDCMWSADGQNEDVLRIENIYYKYDSATHNAAVVGIDGNKEKYVIVGTFDVGDSTYTVNEIAADAFSRDNNEDIPAFYSIIIPDTVTKIGANAFAVQININEIVISENVTDIADDAFFAAFDIYGGTTVYFKGKASNWASMAEKLGLEDNYSVYYYAAQKPDENPTQYWHFVDESCTQPEIYKEGEEWHDFSSGIIYTYYTAGDRKGTAQVSGFNKTGLNLEIVIPDKIYMGVDGDDEYIVDTICERVFVLNNEEDEVKTSISSVILPDSIKTIELQAFNGLNSLEYLVIGNHIERIGTGAFVSAFKNNAKLYFRGNAAEWSATEAKLIELENSQGRLGLLDLPVYLYSLNEPTDGGKYWHFVDGSEKAAEPWFEGTYIDSLSGLVYSYNERFGTAVLIGVETIENNSSTELRIPDHITIGEDDYDVIEIGAKAFFVSTSSGIKYTTVIIPDTVTVIGAQAFWSQTLIEHFVIPNSITFIGTDAFSGAFSYGKCIIYFGGNDAAWETFTTDFTDFARTVNNRGCEVYMYAENPTQSKYGLWKFENGDPTIFQEPPQSQPQTGEVEEDFITYSYNTADQTATVIKCEVPNPVVRIKDKIVANGIECFVTAIADEVFRPNMGPEVELSTVIIPDTVKTIGKQAFQGQPLKAIVIGNNVTQIGDLAFADYDYSYGSGTTYFPFTGKLYFSGTSEQEYNAFKQKIIELNSAIVEEGHGIGIENVSDENVFYFASDRPNENPTKYWHYVDGLPIEYFDGETYTDTETGFSYVYYPDNTAKVVGFDKAGDDLVVTVPRIVHIGENDYTVTAIGDNVFSGNVIDVDKTTIIAVILPDTITSIGERAFFFIYLQYLVIGKNVKTYGAYSMAGAISTDGKLYFYGNDAEDYETFMANLTESEHEYGVGLKNDLDDGSITVYYFSSGAPEGDGNYWYYDNDLPVEWPVEEG